jgi:hypothetical protein
VWPPLACRFSAAETIVKIDELTISGARWMIQQF